MSEGKIQVVVRSRMVPASVRDVQTTRVSNWGTVRNECRRSVTYESRLDDEHLKAVEEGRRLAMQMGLPLEVIDESKASLLRRVITSSHRSPGSPMLVITPAYAAPVVLPISPRCVNAQ